MKLEPHWRILTVGDGDLSFSAALQLQHCPKSLTATVLDEENVLQAKYAQNGAGALSNSPATVHFGIDIQDRTSWLGLLGAEFDLVVFQFPLIGAQASESGVRLRGETTNLLNRTLLYDFLRACRDNWLAPDGAGLCYVTSKEVKPYVDWRIEGLADTLSGLSFLGTLPFDGAAFEGYRVRNVERDKHVRETAATTFIWQCDTAPAFEVALNVPARCLPDHCPLCGHGPFYHQGDKAAHEAGRRHAAMVAFEYAWQQRLQEKEQVRT